MAAKEAVKWAHDELVKVYAQSTSSTWRSPMSRITRRRALQLSSGGLAAILATGRAPAFAQGTTLHWVRGSDYVPVSDQLIRTKLNEQAQKDLGLRINLEAVDGLTIQARVTSSVQSGTGPDIISAINNWAQLYADSVADVSDVAEEIGKAQGGYYETSKAIAYDGKKWLAVPNTIVGLQIVNRTSWWKEIGFDAENYPRTWDEWRAAGKTLKAKGRPLGQTLGHAFGDANAFWYPYLWSWGGKEVEADGKTVVLNSKETIESVKFAVALWKEACDEGALAWDDSGNNRAFLAGTISATNNGASIYLEAKKKPDSYLTADGKPLRDDCFHTALPKGPGGQFSYHVPFADMVMRYGKNQKAAKDFLTQQGFSVGPTKMWEKHKLWKDDPIMAPFRTAAESGRFAGYAGPAGRKAAEVISKYLISDMYAKAVQGMPVEQAVRSTHDELVRIYA
jgi:multiple sugar transport system substrate-binding protein